MKIVSLKTKIQYEIAPIRDTENQMPCPECSSQRKHQKAKSFSWNNTKMTGYCFNCESSFVEYKPFKDEKKYILPTAKNKTGLTDKAMQYFISRGISQNTINHFKIYSDTEWMPQFEKEVEVFCFPFYFNGKLINVKYRGSNKSFKLHKDSELIFYNQDVIYKFDSIIIVEGEFDCISIFESGVENVISVPNGSNKNLQYLDNYYSLFEGKKIIIATDNDLKGVELKDELIRRFGAERCSLVEFKDCKDANEYLTTYGRNELKKITEEAKLIPIEGIVCLNENYKEIYNMFLNGVEEGKKIGVNSFDSKVTWELGRLATWTGIPSHGKSEIVDWVSMLLNLRYGWKIAYFSPENYPIKWHYRKIAEKLFGKQFNSNNMTTEDFNMIFSYVEQNYDFIYPEEDFTFENIMKKAEYLVKTKGIKIFVIDPYNKIEHKREKSETETEYISRFLDAVTTFAKKNNVLVHLVAHPRKMPKNQNGSYEKPNLYDINGCYSDDTEILTEKGWVFHKNYKGEEKIAAFDIHTGLINYELPLRIHKYKYVGEMHQYKGSMIDALVTPNHRMVVKPYWRHNPKNINDKRIVVKKWQFIESDKLSSSQWSIRGYGKLDKNNKSLNELKLSESEIYNSEKLMKLIGWYISEGGIQCNSITICQAEGLLQENMEETLISLNIDFKKLKHLPSGRGIQIVYSYRIRKKSNPLLVNWIIDNFGVGCKKKYISQFIFENCSLKEKEILLNSIIEGDGHVCPDGNISYCSTSKFLIDDIQRLVIELGMRATFYNKKIIKLNHSDSYGMHITPFRRNGELTINSYQRRKINYNGFVYCLTTSTGAYVTRRNGKVSFQGNSANFYNKTDYGFSVYRYFDDNPHVEVDILKVKFKHLGEGGQVDFHYNSDNGRLEETFVFESDFDTSSYIKIDNTNKKIENNLDFETKKYSEIIPF